MRLTVRRYMSGDLGSLWATIDAVCGAVPYMATDRFEPSPAWRRVLTQPACRDHLLLVALDGHDVCGWCRLFPVGDDKRSAFELGIGLRAAYCGQGWGSAMLRRAQAWALARGARPIVLETHPDNLPAIRCFTRCGFRDLGLRSAERLEMRWVATVTQGAPVHVGATLSTYDLR